MAKPLLGAGISAYALRKLLRLPFADCDHATASAPALPQHAYRGQVVWITGASSGIGREMARQLAAQGARLILSARREAVLQEVKRELGLSDTDAYVLPLDLDDLESLPGKAEIALSAFGHVDVMVNNGGISTRALGRDTKFEVDMKVMRVDFLAHACIARALLPSMIERKSGLFINISSLAGKMGPPLRTSYSAAKAALLAHFDSLRCEEAALGSGIKVCNACPGSVQTAVSANALDANGSAFGVTDPNILNGLPVERCVERILAGAHSGLNELWIAKGQELLGCYLSQYAPAYYQAVVANSATKMIEHTLQSRL